jgi:hypothetical protein
LNLQKEINRLTFELAIDSGSNGISPAESKTPSAPPDGRGTSPKSDMETLDDKKNISVGFGGGRMGVELQSAQELLSNL